VFDAELEFDAGGVAPGTWGTSPSIHTDRRSDSCPTDADNR